MKTKNRTLAGIATGLGAGLIALAVTAGGANAQTISKEPAKPTVKGCSIVLKNDTTQTLRYERPSGFKATVVPSTSQSLCGNESDCWHGATYDVVVNVTDQQSRAFSVVTNNPWIGAPIAAVQPKDDRNIKGERFEVDDTKVLSKDNVPYKVIVQRHADSDDFKNFTMRIVAK